MEIAPKKKLAACTIGGCSNGCGATCAPTGALFFLSVMLMPLNTLFALAQPYIFKLTIDLFLRHNRAAPPGWLAPVLDGFRPARAARDGLRFTCCCWSGEFSSFYGQFYLTMMVAQYSLSDLRLALFSHVERLPMAFFDRTPAGRLVSRMTTDIDAINEMFSAGLAHPVHRPADARWESS